MPSKKTTPPKKKYVQTQATRTNKISGFTAPDWAHDKLARLAEAYGQSKSGMIVQLIAEADVPEAKTKTS